jgi:hypothetical protein
VAKPIQMLREVARGLAPALAVGHRLRSRFECRREVTAGSRISFYLTLPTVYRGSRIPRTVTPISARRGPPG